jgi:hypothetical protein
MKMAKASKDDLRRVREFMDAVEEYLDYGTYTKPDDECEEESVDLTPSEFAELVRDQFSRGLVRACWRRVVYGCDILIDEVCDPAADTLEWKPEIAKLLAEVEA